MRLTSLLRIASVDGRRAIVVDEVNFIGLLCVALLHSRRADRHIRDGESFRLRLFFEQAQYLLGGHMSLDEITAHFCGVTRAHPVWDANALLDRTHVVDVVHFGRKACLAHVFDPQSTAAATWAFV